MITPFIWQSEKSDEWYYENKGNKQEWIEYNRGKIDFCAQISIDTDFDDYLVLVLECKNNSIRVNLTQGKRIINFNQNNTEEESYVGFWQQNDSEHLKFYFEG